MFKHFRDYFWKKGKPYGVDEVDPEKFPVSFKIVSDPYQKRLSIEKYQFFEFEKIVYDSLLLDFRHLTIHDQIGWERKICKEEEGNIICLLKNQDDRIVFIETLTFEQALCRTCLLSSSHHIPISIHRMYYRRLNDSFNGVMLFDLENHPVMMKIYDVDPHTGEFTTLLKEEWNMQNFSEIISNA